MTIKDRNSNKNKDWGVNKTKEQEEEKTYDMMPLKAARIS